jgi:phage-related protein
VEDDLSNVYFYKDKDGIEPVYEYLRDLAKRKDKDSRIEANKINDYIEILHRYGTKAGLPYIKYLGNELWELRPLRDRIFFVAWYDESYVLLHHFMKKTQKTPAREVDKARRELADLRERGVDNG